MRLRRRILRRFVCRLFEVVFSHMQVVLHRYSDAVADPGRGHVGGELIRQFCLTGLPKVLPQLGPRFQAGPLYDPQEPCPQVHLLIAVSGDTELGAWLRLLNGFTQVGEKFGE